MNYKVSSEPVDSWFYKASHLNLGEIARVTDGTTYMGHTYMGHWVLMTYGRRLISLTNPQCTWAAEADQALLTVRKLMPGEKITIIGE